MLGSQTHARVLGGIAACLFCLATGAMFPAAAQVGAGENALTTMTATVQSVDLNTRMVVLKDNDGQLSTIHAGPEVKNLPQVQPGDRVTISRYQAVALDVTPAAAGSVPTTTQTADTTRAEPGELPAGKTSVVTKITAQVVGINVPENKVMFIGPAGVVRTVIVQRPKVRELLSQLKLGDMVQFTFAEAEAVSLARD